MHEGSSAFQNADALRLLIIIISIKLYIQILCLIYENNIHLVANSSDADRGDLRLVGGSSTAGRLEMQLDGEWTAVCSFRFSATAASVACSQMGLGSTGTVLTDGRLVYALWYISLIWNWWFS